MFRETLELTDWTGCQKGPGESLLLLKPTAKPLRGAKAPQSQQSGGSFLRGPWRGWEAITRVPEHPPPARDKGETEPRKSHWRAAVWPLAPHSQRRDGREGKDLCFPTGWMWPMWGRTRPWGVAQKAK